jgi:glyoxylase I family protein
MIGTLGHVGLGVSDMERSLRFYRDLLGMRVLMDLNIADDRQARVIGVPGAACRIVHLRLGQGTLELFQYSNPVGTNVACGVRQFDRGLIHIGFEVNDFHRHVTELKNKGVQFLGDPVEFRPSVWVVYFRGPDGEVCEFRERPESEYKLPEP